MLIGASPIASSPLGVAFSYKFPLDTGDLNTPIIKVASLADRALIERLQKYPDDLRTLNRRLFEEIVAEIFSGFGYQVELTQRTRDGGKDIIAIKQKEINLRFLIECKRPDPGNHVGVSVVRELYGVKIDDGATKAILATTTHLSKDAKLFVNRHQWELEAKEYNGILSWIDTYLANK